MSLDIKKLIYGFTDYERIQGKSESYTNRFKYDLASFKEYLDLNDIDFIRLTIEEAQGFQGYLLDKRTKMHNNKYSDSSIIRCMLIVKYFYNYLREEKYIYNNPFEYVRLVKSEKKILRTLLREKELINFLDKLSKFNEEDYLVKKVSRFKAYVISELMYSTGMRISEIALLKEEDIDFENDTIKITGIKTKKERIGFLNEYVKKLLKLYLKEIRSLCIRSLSKSKDYLFCASVCGISDRLNNLLKRIDENIQFSSHNFRHSFGYHFLKRGCDIRYIQIFLGHESINNTQVYTKVDKEDLKNALDNFHPRRWQNEKVG